jgi:dipeptidyl aminopeptidase/acylaminoacyl peptidase
VALEGPLLLEPVIDLDEASCFPLDVNETAILFASSSLHVAPDVYISGSDGADSQRLTDLNGERYGEPRFRVHELSFDGADGTPVEGWYLEPLHRTAPHPTLLHVHGGPFAGQGHIFSFEDHLAVDAGYGMLLVNYRGSSGYGERFAAQIVGHYGEHDHSDLVRAVDHVVELGLADPDALGCYGVSSGGFETVWMVTHTNRFKAAVAEALADRYFALAADIYGLMPTLAGSPVGVGVEAMSAYVTKSLIPRAADCTTPLLIIVNEHDRRCPTQGSDALYNVLKLHGAEVEMLRMPGAYHESGASELGSPRTRVAQNEALIAWMSDHLNV